jgi:hypothetical protein
MKTIVLTCPKYEGSKMGWKEIKIEKYYLMCMEYISSCMVYNYLLKTVLGNIFVLRLFMYMHIYGLDNIFIVNTRYMFWTYASYYCQCMSFFFVIY